MRPAGGRVSDEPLTVSKDARSNSRVPWRIATRAEPLTGPLADRDTQHTHAQAAEAREAQLCADSPQKAITRDFADR